MIIIIIIIIANVIIIIIIIITNVIIIIIIMYAINYQIIKNIKTLCLTFIFLPLLGTSRQLFLLSTFRKNYHNLQI